jgi:hypothetical protein
VGNQPGGRVAVRRTSAVAGPRPWDARARREIDRTATSHYDAILAARMRVIDLLGHRCDATVTAAFAAHASWLANGAEPTEGTLPDELRAEILRQVEQLFTRATRHKNEVEYALRHWATPAERTRVAERLRSLDEIRAQITGYLTG